MAYHCNQCDKAYVRRENLELHKERNHPVNDIDDDSVSMQESLNADESETEATIEVNTDKSESETETRTEASADESDSETEALTATSTNESDSEIDEEPQELLLRKTMTAAHLEVRTQAEDLSYDAYLETVRKVFIDKYSIMLSQQNGLNESRIHQKVQDTIDRLKEQEDYSIQEATKYALHKRRYLFDELLNEQTPVEGEEWET